MVSLATLQGGIWIVMGTVVLFLVVLVVARWLGLWGRRRKRLPMRAAVSEELEEALAGFVRLAEDELEITILDGARRQRRQRGVPFRWAAVSDGPLDKAEGPMKVSVVSAEIVRSSPGVWTAALDADMQLEGKSEPATVIVAHMDEESLFEGERDAKLTRLERQLETIAREATSWVVHPTT